MSVRLDCLFGVGRRYSTHLVSVPALLILMTSAPVRGGDSTAELLRAPHVRRALFVRLTNPKANSLLYSIDTLDVGKTFPPNPTFAADDEVAFIFPEYNPLQFQITGGAQDKDDPNYVQLKDYVSKLADFQKLVIDSKAAFPGKAANAESPEPKGAPESKTPKALGSRANEKRAMAEQGKTEASPYDGKPLTCATFEAALIRAADVILTSPRIALPGDLETWVEKAHGKKGIKDVSDEIRDAVKKLDKQLDDAHNALAPLEGPLMAYLKELAKSKPAESARTPRPCPNPLSLEALSALSAIANWADHFFIHKTNLKISLTALAERLDSILEDASWEPGSDDRYVFLRKRIGLEKLATVTITMSKVQVVQSKEDRTTTLLLSEAVTQTLTLRQYELLIPEMGVGAVFSGLRVPKYGTATVAGTTVVQSGGSEAANLTVAALLNGVVKVGQSSWAYPMMQLGINVDREAPALLVGAGLRLTKPDKVGLAGGLAIGWIRDLDKLTLNGPVSGTAAIEADLKRQVRFSYYLAIQYQF